MKIHLWLTGFLWRSIRRLRGNLKFTVLIPGATPGPMGYAVVEAAKMAREGKKAEEIAAFCERLGRTIVLFILFHIP